MFPKIAIKCDQKSLRKSVSVYRLVQHTISKRHIKKHNFVLECGFDRTVFLCVSVSHSNRTVPNLTCKDPV